MKKLLPLILLITSSANAASVAPSFREIYEVFKQAAAVMNVNVTNDSFLTIMFHPLGESNQESRVIGYCHKEAGKRYVLVDPIFWKSASPTSRSILLFHELGHCMLNLEHNPNPHSVMHYMVDKPESYLRNKRSPKTFPLMIQEMFRDAR